MDRNTVIGFGLLAVLFLAYFYYTQQGQKAFEQQKKHVQDSLDRLKPKADTAKLVTIKDTIPPKKALPAGIVQDTSIAEQLLTVENQVFKISFTNKGGQPHIIQLKDFKTFDGKPVLVNDGKSNDLSYPILAGSNQVVNTKDLTFTAAPVSTSGKDQIVTYTLHTKDGREILHQYTIHPDNYMIDLQIKFKGAEGLFTNNTMSLAWDVKADQMEKDRSWEIQQSHFSFLSDEGFDFEHFREGSENDKTFKKPVEWIALNQQFFISTLVAKDKFESGEVHWQSPKDSTNHIVGTLKADMKLKVPPGQNVSIPLQLYYGPSDYKILKSYGNEMFNMVPLGYGIFAFVKYINRGFIMPVFNFLAKFIKSYGLVIALLTIIIRLLISPLTYQSYLSGAKMKLLKPEIEQLKAKYKDDKQAFGMQQMKLFKSAGVNPLGGCIPALFQIPIFFALYAFFNSNIALRGVSFWWASDLSTYDSIVSLPFNVPFYGDHVSLFTILATISSLLISLYGMSNMQDTGNPVMKYMPYIFPVVLLGVFNNLPSALTWYYTVSNTITLLIQYVIQTKIINHEVLMAKLQENKKKPTKKSKWQHKIDAMQQSQEKIKQLREKTGGKRGK